MEERMNMLWFAHTMEYYTAMKKEQTTGTHNIEAPHRHYAERKHPCMISYTKYTPILTVELESGWWLPAGGGGWMEGLEKVRASFRRLSR